MYLSRLELLPEAAASPQMLVELADVYKEHQAIWRLLADSPDRRRDFLFRRESSGYGARWYVLSERQPRDERGMWKIETKEIEPKLEAGQQLQFAVRVNPTVAKTREGRSSARHDVVMDAKRRLGKEERRGAEADLVQRAGIAWLEKRAERNGFRFKPAEVQVDGYRQHAAGKGAGIRFSTVEIAGRLTITDTARFRAMLCGGLGPAKSFGCGLVLVHRG